MMKRTMHLIALLFVCFSSLKTVKYYLKKAMPSTENNFEKAIAIYTEIIDEQNLGSKELYFNLGNAYYKTNKIGPSIYYYEKALSLDPTDSDVLNNLSFAQKMTIDRIEVLPVSFGERFRKATILQLHPQYLGHYCTDRFILVCIVFSCCIGFHPNCNSENSALV